MILVDSSVWIGHLRGHRTAATGRLEAAAGREPLLIGDLILLEVLQGARDESHAARIERELRRYAVAPLLDADLAHRAARNYRKLRDWASPFVRRPTSSSAHSASSTAMHCSTTTAISRRWSSISV